MLTLWDLIDPLLSKLVAKPPAPRPRLKAPEPARPQPQAARIEIKPPASPGPARPLQSKTHPKRRRAGGESADAGMQAKYDAVVRQMLATHGIRVRKWRKSMSGIAWYVLYRDGTRVNLIESPRPKGPMSIAIFLHEIGHHAIGFDVYKPRCLEEYHAWRWSMEAMQQHGLNITDAVRLRMHRSLWYAVQKAKRRGIKRIPEELAPYLEKPSFARRRRRAA